MTVVEALTYRSVVLSVVAVVLAIPPFKDLIERRRHHVRLVSARLEEKRLHIDGDVHSWMHDGGVLTIRNSSDFPVRNVIVTAPDALAAMDFTLIGPGETHTREIPEGTMQSITDTTVCLQVDDVNNRCWRWTPETQDLLPIPAPLPPVARFVQWTARRWPQSWHEHFVRLPKRVQRVLCGHDPEGPGG